MKQKLHTTGSGKLAVIAAVGFLVAAATFFVAFITTQKAKTPNPHANLRIPVSTNIPRPTLPPLKKAIILPSPATESPISSESGEQTKSTATP